MALPLCMPDRGWYGLRVTLADAGGRPLIEHAAAFALLGRDTRTAGFESPFGTWWFGVVHYTTGDPAVAGPMLFKAGFRRTTMADPAQWHLVTDDNAIATPLRRPGEV